MIVNINELRIAYINLDSYPNRNQSMINMLTHYGLNFVRIPGVLRNNNYDPVGDAHMKALSVRPDIILEDDCVPLFYKNEIEIPDDADVVYLGVSTGTTKTHQPKYQKISNSIYRLYDMTSAHAILYATEKGKGWLKESYKLSKEKGIGFDMATAKLMPTIKAYGLNYPLWYQKDVPDQTKLTLDEAMSLDDHSGGGFPDYDKPITNFEGY